MKIENIKKNLGKVEAYSLPKMDFIIMNYISIKLRNTKKYKPGSHKRKGSSISNCKCSAIYSFNPFHVKRYTISKIITVVVSLKNIIIFLKRVFILLLV